MSMSEVVTATKSFMLGRVESVIIRGFPNEVFVPLQTFQTRSYAELALATQTNVVTEEIRLFILEYLNKKLSSTTMLLLKNLSLGGLKSKVAELAEFAQTMNPESWEFDRLNTNLSVNLEIREVLTEIPTSSPTEIVYAMYDLRPVSCSYIINKGENTCQS